MGHVYEFVDATKTGASLAERFALSTIEGRVVTKCQHEGLNEAQLECIVSVHTYGDFAGLASCPAIAQQRPSWLQLVDAIPRGGEHAGWTPQQMREELEKKASGQ